MHALIKAILIVVWLGQLGSVGLAAFILVSGMTTAAGAPQEAVVAALACAVAILPYCFARGLTEMMSVARVPEKVKYVEPKPKVDPTRATLGLG